MGRSLTISAAAAALAVMLAAAGCVELPNTAVETTIAETRPAPAPSKDVNAIARQLDTVEERLTSLAREVQLFGQRSQRNQTLINELTARLSTMESDGPGASPATEKKAGQVNGELSLEKLYLSAYRKYLAGDYPLAIRRFSDYLTSYPRSRLADNALYWMGDAYYKLEDFPRAIDLLNRVEQEYHGANRAPYALYRLGLIHYELGDRAAAEAQFRKVMEFYPGSDPARLASVRVGKLKGNGENSSSRAEDL